ncbi:unnamed protein product [Euphydryas editha]|uniref:Uncharacterized protein n=1 Tax=Euphydryas editha TaxID=104508 RepID=A0AAU9URU4_EUPED|nr:unnamed protein product [Euphydryas editha]
MPYYCTVPRCTSMAGKTKNVSFHQFPRDEELAEIWNKILKRGKPYTKYSKVCSLHFTPEDYSFTTGQKTGQWRTLRKDAIPSKNLPSSTPSSCQRNDSLSWPSQSSKLNIGMQHRLVQAVYVQTMFSMQGASISTPSKEQSSEEVKSRRPLEINNHNVHINEKQEISMKTNHNTQIFKCDHCSMCFKDPDVFLLHQRNHPKTEIATQEMLKANPILANMLKSDKPQTSMQKTDAMDVKNFNNIENQMMADWTTNMDNYMNNLSTVVTNGSTVDNESSDNNKDSDDAMSNCDNEDSNLVIDEINS